MDQNNVSQGTADAIRAAFELQYAMDADDPSSATELSHFINGWHACMSQVRTPVADERAAFARSITGRDVLEPHQVQNVIDANGSRWATWRDRAALATVPLANQPQIRLSAEVVEYLKEGIENATQCEEADVDHDFANELGRLMQGPLFGAPAASAPVAGAALQVATRAMQLIRRSALDVFDRQQHDKLIHDFAGLHERPAAVALASETSVPGGGQAAGDVANSRSTGSGHGPE